MYLIMQLLVDFLYTLRNFVIVYQQKRNIAAYMCNRFTLNVYKVFPYWLILT